MDNDVHQLRLLSGQVAEGCVECGLCGKNCLFLQQYGTPKQIAEKNRESDRLLAIGFECSLCGLCTAVCPKDIDPAAMFFAMRQAAQQAGRGTFSGHSSLLAYERWGTSPFFSWSGLPEGCDTVFFPGCALAGSRAGRVTQLYVRLRRIIPSLGMVLDCCTKPSHDLGRGDYFHSRFDALRDGLAEKGIRRVLVACPSCYRVWSDYGGPVRVETVYEQLSGDGRIMPPRPVTVTVHDPCPTRNETDIHRAVRSLVTAMGLNIREMKHQGRTTYCCGEGGAAGHIAPHLAGNWTTARAAEAEGLPIITYCAGCTHFLGRLATVAHLADLLCEPEKTLAGRIRATRAPMTWVHRLLLKLRLKRLVDPAVTGRRRKDGTVVFRGGESGRH